jgi:hypothetical protein
MLPELAKPTSTAQRLWALAFVLSCLVVGINSQRKQSFFLSNEVWMSREQRVNQLATRSTRNAAVAAAVVAIAEPGHAGWKMVTLVLVPSVHSLCPSRRPSLRRGRPMAHSWLFCAQCPRDFNANRGTRLGGLVAAFCPVLSHCCIQRHTLRHHVVLQGSLSAAAQGQTLRHTGARSDAGPALQRRGAEGGKRANLPGPRDPPDNANTRTCSSSYVHGWSLMLAPVSPVVVVLLC